MTALAAHVAAKLCHDFISPAGAIVSGLDLLNDPSAQDMRVEALGLINASARKLVAIVHFARIAFGAANSTERFDAAELKSVLEAMFEHQRATMHWGVEIVTFEKAWARILVNMAYLGGGALPTGGTATVSAREESGRVVIEVAARGPRARLKAEMATGLRGETLTDGLAGQWIQSYWLAQLVADARGELGFETGEELVRLRASLPH